MFLPDWHQENIFPLYSEIFEIIPAAGKKVLYVCDGNIIPLLDQIIETAPDGISIDGHADLETVVKKFSGKIIAGGMNPSTISRGTPEEIENKVRRTVAIVKDEPGYFFQCPGMNGSTPIANVLHYQKCIKELGRRDP